MEVKIIMIINKQNIITQSISVEITVISTQLRW